MTELVVAREPWTRRALGWVLRALSLTPADFRAGADYGSHTAAAPNYDPTQALSAYAGNPWVYASINCIATDLSSLPMRMRTGDDPKAQVVEKHPMLDLMNQPTAGVLGRQFRRQEITDLLLAGEAPELILPYLVGGRPVPPTGLLRLHPSRMRPVSGDTGQIVEWEYSHAGTITRYPASMVSCPRMQSWANDPRDLHGVGAIQPLHRDLVADAALADRASSSARSGKPAAIARPSRDGDIWGPEIVTAFKDALSRSFRENDGGIAVIGGQAVIDVIGWDAKELQIPEQRKHAIAVTIAALGMMPTRVGIQAANFATAKQEAVIYWENLKGLAALLDDERTAIARRFKGSEGVIVYHDFSGVEALMEVQDAKLARAEKLVMSFGVPEAAALAYVGLADVPVPPPSEAGPVGPVQDLGLNGAQITGLLAILAAVSDGTLSEDGAVAAIVLSFPTIDETEASRLARGAMPAAPPPDPPKPAAQGAQNDGSTKALDSEVTRAAEWRGWVARAHTPATNQLKGPAQRWLVAARQRTVARATAALKAAPLGVTRSATDDLLKEIFPLESERAELKRLYGDRLDKVVEAAMKQTCRRLKIPFESLPNAGAVLLDALADNVTTSTLESVRAVLEAGLDDGLSAADISRDLQTSGAFSPNRAMLIARTEATRATNAGHTIGIANGTAAGLTVRKQWLSSRDDAVRDTHASLDGQTVDDGKKFVSSSGDRAEFPGDFADPAESCNCRCTVIPIVD